MSDGNVLLIHVMVGSSSGDFAPRSKGVHMTIDSQFESVNHLLQSIGFTFTSDARQMTQSEKRNQADHPGSVDGKLQGRICCYSGRDSDQVSAENENRALAEQRFGTSFLLFRIVRWHEGISV